MTILPSWKQAPVAVFEYSQHPESLGMHYSSIEKVSWISEWRSTGATRQVNKYKKDMREAESTTATWGDGKCYSNTQRCWWALTTFFNICFEKSQERLLCSQVHVPSSNLHQFLLSLSLFAHLQSQEFPPLTDCSSETLYMGLSAAKSVLWQAFPFLFLFLFAQADGLTGRVLFLTVLSFSKVIDTHVLKGLGHLVV